MTVTFDRITMIRLRHNVTSLPAGPHQAYLFRLMWEECRKRMGVSLHNHLPARRIYEIDDAALALLNELGVEARRIYDDREERRFLIAGVEVWYGRDGWTQG